LANGRFDFQSNWEEKGYKNMVELLLEMMELIHQLGDVVMGCSDFYVVTGITTLHQVGVYISS
jgi:hypothetical protein